MTNDERALRMLPQVVDWRAGAGNGGPEVFAERPRQRRRDLVRERGRRIGPLAAPRPVRAGGYQPRFVRADDILAVIGPVVRAVPAPVVRGDEQNGVVLVVRVGLQPGPELLQVAVRAVQ